MTNPWREDISIWEALREGEAYTIDTFLDDLHEPELSAAALYPIQLDKGWDWPKASFPSRFDIPTYDHDAGVVELRETAVETMVDMLEHLAEKEERGKTAVGMYGRSLKEAPGNAARYGDYALKVRGDEERIIRLRERDLSRDT